MQRTNLFPKCVLNGSSKGLARCQYHVLIVLISVLRGPLFGTVVATTIYLFVLYSFISVIFRSCLVTAVI